MSIRTIGRKPRPHTRFILWLLKTLWPLPDILRRVHAAPIKEGEFHYTIILKSEDFNRQNHSPERLQCGFQIEGIRYQKAQEAAALFLKKVVACGAKEGRDLRIVRAATELLEATKDFNDPQVLFEVGKLCSAHGAMILASSVNARPERPSLMCIDLD